MLALLVGGCDSTDTRYFRYGIGTDLYSSDIVETTQYQDLYLSELCRQALPVVSTSDGQCLNAALRPSDWTLLVQAGLNDVDRRCDAYLAWLDDRRRTNNSILKELGDTAVASQGIMRVAGVGANPITLAGLAFGFAANTFTNVNSRLLLEVDRTTVQTLVLRRRDQFRLDIMRKTIPDRPSAIHALRLYLSICTPFTIESDINSTVTIFQQAGGAALDRSDPLISTSTITSATAPLPPVRKNPVIVAPTTRLSSYEQSLTKPEIKEFQQAVCVSPTGDLGPLGSETRTKIKAALGASDEVLTDRKGILLRRKLRDGPSCSPG
ncbi:MAG: hypothetical protein HXX15_15015 [Rhodopseudomonas sp.]|uniref:hypothetical protein n=1 Tax=Rhodopseudomonas sp. TaxID=1078 RepID=UPI00181A5483|nr:hypothetical protein [Rhodopseudomonas sp.]NVN87388.1 hypothetical protein [Rhodopseudomonas sp.]